MTGGNRYSFDSKLAEIRSAEPGKPIKIDVKYYNPQVRLEGQNGLGQRMIFKDFLQGVAQKTPTSTEAAVENLYNGAPDDISQGDAFKLYYDDADTGIQLLLYRKPELYEILSDNEDMEDMEDPLNIAFIFQKV